jgi:Domain of unknown function (DUF4190)
MSTPNEPQNPYGAGEPQQPQDPSGAPQYPAAPQPPAGTPQYPSAPQYPNAGGAPQYPGATPYGSAPSYQQPAAAGYGYTYPKNSLGVWSLVLGIVSFVLSCGLFTGIPAVIVGNKAKQAVARGEANNGGMATAGIILGWVAIALSIIGAILLAVLFSSPDFRDAFNEGYNSSY